jgi:hypothetical protein
MNNKYVMIALEVFYVALSTIAVMVILQLITFVGTRMMYPPEPKIIYRDVPVMQQPPQMMPPPPTFPPMQPPVQQNGPTLTQGQQEVQLPEYEPRKPTSTSLRVDPELPAGLQETRPDGI